MKNPLSPKELYLKLQGLLKPMNKYKETQGARLTVEDVELMKQVYPDVQVLSSGGLATHLNVGCDSCVREAFQVFIALYDRLDADPTVNTEAEHDGQGFAPQPATVNQGVDYSDQLPKVGETDTHAEPLEITQAPDPAPEPVEEVNGMALNTTATMTPAQKAAATKARNKAIKDAEQAAAKTE